MFFTNCLNCVLCLNFLLTLVEAPNLWEDFAQNFLNNLLFKFVID